MNTTHNLRTSVSTGSRRGFTLIEIIAVLVLLGILAAVAVPRYIDLTAAAEDRAVDAAIAELNGREALSWSNEMISSGAAPVDADVFAGVAANDLGADYSWSVAPTVAGGTVDFGDASVALTRAASTSTSPGRWSR